MRRQQNLASVLGIQKGNWGKPRIFQRQFGKERHTLLCILRFLQILLINYPQFSFWISITLAKICFSRIVSKARKNTFDFVGTVLYHFSLYSTVSLKKLGIIALNHSSRKRIYSMIHNMVSVKSVPLSMLS